jgi:hypothetical protein
VEIRVTNATVLDDDEYLARARTFELEVVHHDKRTARGLEQSGAHIPKVVVLRRRRAAVPILRR